MCTEKKTQHLKPLAGVVFDELKSHMEERKSLYPFPDGKYEYYWRFEEGDSYKKHYRRKISDCTDENQYRDYYGECRECGEGGEEEELLLDENWWAEGSSFFDVAATGMCILYYMCTL